ncbi:MAG: YggT family protein [Anaerolineae bacterium]
MMVFIVNFIDILFEVLSLAILARVILSWFRVDPYNRFVQILFQVTEPVLAPFRKIIPPMGTIDITPIVALLVLQIAQRIIVTMLVQML